MSKRRSRRPRKENNKPQPAAREGDPLARLASRLRGILLAGAVALLVATPLFPSEGGHLGGGTLLNMLWVLLLLGWSLWGLLQGSFPLRFGRVDVCVYALFLSIIVSAAVMAPEGNARYAISSLWQWVGYGVGFFLIRQLADGPVACRSLWLVVIGLTVCLAMHGLWQYVYQQPLQWKLYDQSSELAKQVQLRELGVDPDPGSPHRSLAENRMRSVEPLASFALANSLAGILAPGLIAVLGMLLAGGLSRRGMAALIAGGLLIAFCLLLTKSRTAWLATMLGCGLLWWRDWRTDRKIGWKIPVIALTIVVALLIGAVAVGGVDVEVLSQAKLSLTYRLEYWQATMAMIADHPWLGCGAGNFQQYYQGYKLPQASEEIADPHNFILEIWSNAGGFALLALLTAAGCYIWYLRKNTNVAQTEQHIGKVTLDSRMVVYLGAVVGVLMSLPVGWLANRTPEALQLPTGASTGIPVVWLVGLPLAAVGIWLLSDWTIRSRLPNWLPPIVLAVMLTNLLASGGISIAGLAHPLWMLAALSLNLTQAGGDCRRLPRWSAFYFVLVGVCLAGACLATEYSPVLRGKALLAEGARAESDGQNVAAMADYQRAARIDPFSPEPWRRRAALAHRLWMEGRHSSDAVQQQRMETAFEQSVQQLLSRHKKSSKARSQIGHWYFQWYRDSRQGKYLGRAIELYRQAVDLYPNSSIARAQLAWAHHLAGNEKQAAQQAVKALRLDQLNPHREFKLSGQKLFDPELSDSTAEPLMLRLRKTGIGKKPAEGL